MQPPCQGLVGLLGRRFVGAIVAETVHTLRRGIASTRRALGLSASCPLKLDPFRPTATSCVSCLDGCACDDSDRCTWHAQSVPSAVPP